MAKNIAATRVKYAKPVNNSDNSDKQLKSEVIDQVKIQIFVALDILRVDQINEQLRPSSGNVYKYSINPFK